MTPAKNYRKRARAIIEVLLGQTKVLVGDRYHAPTPELMERFIDCFHHVCNWGLDGAKRLGFPVMYYTGPLTEAQFRAVEKIFLGKEQPS
jgi:hypothetical protein